MDFLKIAIGDGVNVTKMKDWASIPIGDVKNSAELAAIVVRKNDAVGKKEAQNLLEQSGFPIPLIEVADKINKNLLTIKIIYASKSLKQKSIVWLSQIARGFKNILALAHEGIKEWQHIEKSEFIQLELRL